MRFKPKEFHQLPPTGSPDSFPDTESEVSGIQIDLKQTGEQNTWRIQRDVQCVKALRIGLHTYLSNSNGLIENCAHYQVRQNASPHLQSQTDHQTVINSVCN